MVNATSTIFRHPWSTAKSLSVAIETPCCGIEVRHIADHSNESTNTQMATELLRDIGYLATSVYHQMFVRAKTYLHRTSKGCTLTETFTRSLNSKPSISSLCLFQANIVCWTSAAVEHSSSESEIRRLSTSASIRACCSAKAAMRWAILARRCFNTHKPAPTGTLVPGRNFDEFCIQLNPISFKNYFQPLN